MINPFASFRFIRWNDFLRFRALQEKVEIVVANDLISIQGSRCKTSWRVDFFVDGIIFKRCDTIPSRVPHWMVHNVASNWSLCSLVREARRRCLPADGHWTTLALDRWETATCCHETMDHFIIGKLIRSAEGEQYFPFVGYTILGFLVQVPRHRYARGWTTKAWSGLGILTSSSATLVSASFLNLNLFFSLTQSLFSLSFSRSLSSSLLECTSFFSSPFICFFFLNVAPEDLYLFLPFFQSYCCFSFFFHLLSQSYYRFPLCPFHSHFFAFFLLLSLCFSAFLLFSRAWRARVVTTLEKNFLLCLSEDKPVTLSKTAYHVGHCTTGWGHSLIRPREECDGECQVKSGKGGREGLRGEESLGYIAESYTWRSSFSWITSGWPPGLAFVVLLPGDWIHRVRSIGTRVVQPNL